MGLGIRRALALVWLFAFPAAVCADSPRYVDPENVDEDFAYQGEYTGQLGEDRLPWGVQVIAEGRGQFQAVAYSGGLPGDGWDRQPPVRTRGQLQEGRVPFQTEEASGILTPEGLAIYNPAGDRLGKLEKVHRQSPTLGAEPPENAVVLFDGTPESVENWRNGRITEDGLLMEGTTSRRTFGDHRIHFEFRNAYQPQDRGQRRSNSGLYVQGRYEVQILDSFGLEGKHDECGGIYSVRDPDVNMCYPPLAWQTFEIDFTAARYDDEGKRTANPRMTVRHNGVVIHDDVTLPGDRSTTAAPLGPGPEPGPIYLQDHGAPLRYRNIWVIEPRDN